LIRSGRARKQRSRARRRPSQPQSSSHCAESHSFRSTATHEHRQNTTAPFLRGWVRILDQQLTYGDRMLNSDARPCVRFSGVSRSGPGFVPGISSRPGYATGGTGMLGDAEDFQSLFVKSLRDAHVTPIRRAVSPLSPGQTDPHKQFVQGWTSAWSVRQSARLSGVPATRVTPASFPGRPLLSRCSRFDCGDDAPGSTYPRGTAQPCCYGSRRPAGRGEG